jgi:hypothetical protein
MNCPGCGSSLWDEIKCTACGRLGTDLTPRSVASSINVPMASSAFALGIVMLVLAVLSFVNYFDRSLWHHWFLGGLGLFVAGYQGLFVVPVLHRRLNELEMKAGRLVDAHERRLRALEIPRTEEPRCK